MRARSVSRIFLGCLLVVLTAGCGKVSQRQNMYVVNEEATIRQATASRFKYCNVQAERLCQSPDSQLVFQMPLRVRMDGGFPQYSEEFIIYNDGIDRISIGRYEVKVLDIQGRVYYPQFSGPGGYDAQSATFPALVLGPKQDARVRFWGELNRDDGSGLKAVSVTYTLVGEDQPVTVLVSYQPSHISELAPQPIPSDREN